jgi:hypothetical protein
MHLSIPWLCHLIMIHFMYALDHVRVELEPEELTEQAAAEATNPELAQGKPGCIRQVFLDIYFDSQLYIDIVCALLL